MKHLASFLALLSLVTACDAPGQAEAECPAASPLQLAPPAGAPAVSFREAPYAAYIQEIKGHKIATDDFCDALHACEDVEEKTWILTQTGHFIEPGTSDLRAVGVGGSTLAGPKYWACVSDFFDANGAVQF
jgi:hypothetical protein